MKRNNPRSGSSGVTGKSGKSGEIGASNRFAISWKVDPLTRSEWNNVRGAYVEVRGIITRLVPNTLIVRDIIEVV